MSIGGVGGDPPARCPLQKAELEKIRLVDVLDRLRLLTHRGGQRRQPDRPTLKLRRQGGQDRDVQLVQPPLVDLEQRQGELGGLAADATVATYLGVVANSAEQPVGDTVSTA